MSRKNQDALKRSDRIMIGALAMVLVSASATLGATAAYSPRSRPTAVKIVAAAEPASVSATSQDADAAEVGFVAEPAVARTGFRSAAEQVVLEKLLREHRCLSEAMYYEARGEGVSGEKAVAEVVFHRLRSGKYGDSICDVVFAGASRPGCQFSFTCNGMIRQAKRPKEWTKAQYLAARILTGEVHLNNTTGGATSYHSTAVRPDWATDLTRTVQIGNHIFYRRPYMRTM
jgi:spore germination cell wall hydrolase CwlJ-like protein